MNPSPQTILISGGAGFIGINLCHYWRTHHPNDQVIVLDALTYAANADELTSLINQKAITFYKGQVQDKALCQHIFENHLITQVIHAAAESHVDRSIAEPDIFVETNIIGTHVLLSTALHFWRKRHILESSSTRFHHISTDEVYGSLSLDDPKFTESSPYDPRSPYSASKAASDHLVRAAGHTFGLPFTISNCSNNFGPYQNQEKLIPHMISKILKGEPLPVYGKGANIRDWLYVTDHCHAIDVILKKGTVGETYLIGSENEWDNLSLVKRICTLMDQVIQEKANLIDMFPALAAFKNTSTQTLISFVQDRPGHDFRYAINPKKIQDLGFKPSYDFDACIKQTRDWYIALNMENLECISIH